MIAQILNRTVLAEIWGGQVTTWDHPSIRDLNPDIAAKLPSQTIFVGYSDSNSVLSFPEVFKLTLESFSADFKAQFAAVNRTFSQLPPALNGNAASAGGSSPARAAWLQVRRTTTFHLSSGHLPRFPNRATRTA